MDYVWDGMIYKYPRRERKKGFFKPVVVNVEVGVYLGT